MITRQRLNVMLYVNCLSFFKYPFNPCVPRSFQRPYIFQGFPPKSCMKFSSHPYVPHIQPSWFSMIWPPEWYVYVAKCKYWNSPLHDFIRAPFWNLKSLTILKIFFFFVFYHFPSEPWQQPVSTNLLSVSLNSLFLGGVTVNAVTESFYWTNIYLLDLQLLPCC